LPPTTCGKFSFPPPKATTPRYTRPYTFGRILGALPMGDT
jgi:hypothetical protein